jgi:hypothetical protein
MTGNKSKTLPSFTSVDEFVSFFESHDMGEYWEQLPKAEVEVSLAKKVSAGNSKWRATKSRNASGSNTGKRWTPTQLRRLRQLASQNTPTRIIGKCGANKS